jgi:hypothetical protein
MEEREFSQITGEYIYVTFQLRHISIPLCTEWRRGARDTMKDQTGNGKPGKYWVGAGSEGEGVGVNQEMEAVVRYRYSR